MDILKKPRLLVLEFDEDILIYYQVYLRRKYFAALHSSFEIFYDQLSKGDYDIVIINVNNLPEESVFNIISCIKKISAVKQIPVIGITNFATKRQSDAVRQNGLDALLVRPLLNDILIKTIDNLLNKPQMKELSDPPLVS